MTLAESVGWTSTTLRREISAFLRSTEEPDTLTFKEVRLAVERALSLPAGSLNSKGCKSEIKEAVHSVMDDIDREANTGNGEDGDVEEEFEDGGPVSGGAPPDGVAGHSISDSDNDNNNNSSSSSKRGRDRAESSRDRHGGSSARRRIKAEPVSDSEDNDGNDDAPDKEKTGSNARGQKAVASRAKKKCKADGVEKKAGPRKSTGGGGERGGGKDEDPTLVCVLSRGNSKRRQVNVQTWKGHVQINIREHYLREKTQDFAPTTKGVTLNRTQWNTLRSAAQDVDRMLRQQT